ncbi:MAG: NAD(P)/FAD-dependent oxidoreductase [Pseudomonadota bacterium]
MTDYLSCKVLICGGGPSGLAAALMFQARGWRDIVVVERRPTPDQFERSKAFNYQLDGRGQRLLSELDIGPETLEQFGLPNDHFTLTNFLADGKVKVVQPPILVPDRQTPYWMTRNRLLAMLHQHIEKTNTDGAIRLLYGHSFEGLEQIEDGRLVAQVRDGDDAMLRYEPELLLGCDGLRSRVREALAKLADDANAFDMLQFPSPSTGLTYKVLNLPPQFPVRTDPKGVHDHAMAYAFISNYSAPDEKLALFALPVASAEDPRTINIILKPEHKFWQLKSAEAVTAYLKEGFPQLAIDELVPAGEMEEFAALKPGQFPAPQYTRRIHSEFDRGRQQALLIGDAAHAFPPDLGLGVNSALEDLFELNQSLNAASDETAKASANYAEARVPESEALVQLVRRVHPYQYNQDPLRLKLWMMRFVFQLGLHKLSRGLVEMPGFMLSQKHLMPFTEMRRRFQRGNNTVMALGLAVGLVLGRLLLG